MNKVCSLIVFSIVTLTAWASEQPGEARESKRCNVGPKEKIFGGTKWFLYGCDDAKTAVLFSVEGNPAAPFYFIVFPEGGNYRIYGEGTGSKTASGAALKDLQALSYDALANLVSEANRLKP
jgi:hypothetical protein